MSLGDHIRGVVTSAAVYAALPDEVNQAREAVCDVLPEDMKAVLGVTALTASYVINTLKEKGGEQ